MRDLLGVTTRPATALFAESPPAAEDEQFPSAAAVDAYHTLAHELAAQLTSDPAQISALIDCDPAVTEQSVCAEQLMGELLPRMFRAPLRDEARDQMDAVFASGEALSDSFAGGVRAVLEVALQSPEFLYRVEFGEAAPDVGATIGRPSQPEMAARLSYFLRGAPPDAALLKAAERGKLRTKAQIAEQARRLLTEPDVHDVVQVFYLQHLGLVTPDFAANAGLSAELAQSMLQETAMFIDDVTFEGDGDLNALLTAPFTWVDAKLALHYGIDGVTGDGFEKVALDPSRGVGLLTQGSFLASRTSAGSSNPSKRGAWVLRNLLCTPLPAHPAGANFGVPLAPEITTRERFERALNENTACSACHRVFDRVGFGFEHYGALGQYRETEAGSPIDATGEIVASDAQGSFNGASELASRLANSADVRSCYANDWLSFAYGRKPLPEDACSQQSLQAAFAEANGNILELLVAVTQTDGFLYRPLSEVAP